MVHDKRIEGSEEDADERHGNGASNEGRNKPYNKLQSTKNLDEKRVRR